MKNKLYRLLNDSQYNEGVLESKISDDFYFGNKEKDDFESLIRAISGHIRKAPEISKNVFISTSKCLFSLIKHGLKAEDANCIEDIYNHILKSPDFRNGLAILDFKNEERQILNKVIWDGNKIKFALVDITDEELVKEFKEEVSIIAQNYAKGSLEVILFTKQPIEYTYYSKEDLGEIVKIYFNVIADMHRKDFKEVSECIIRYFDENQHEFKHTKEEIVEFIYDLIPNCNGVVGLCPYLSDKNTKHDWNDCKYCSINQNMYK